jgi:tetratricopeptide (TPR) repeat protein
MRILVAGVIVLSALAARADDLQSAREHYDKGTTFYDLQRFADAAHEYEQAFELKHDPALLFNIGQAYRFAGDSAKAIGAFRSYLRRMPKAPNRAEVEARIAEMQKLLDEQKKGQEKPPAGTLSPDGKSVPNGTVPPTPTPTAEPTSSPVPEKATPQPEPQAPPAPTATVEHPGRTKKIAGLAVGIAGVALVAAGAALTAMGYSTANSINSGNTTFDASYKTNEIAGGVLLGLGAAALVTGAVVGILSLRRDGPPKLSCWSVTPRILVSARAAPGADQRSTTCRSKTEFGRTVPSPVGAWW